MTPLLFYSNSCPHSSRALLFISNAPDVQKRIRFVCVDEQMDKIPSQVDRVPAILVPTPDGNRLLFDSAMYEWLSAAMHPVAQAVDPDEFVLSGDAFLCNIQGEGDGACHLFAGATDDVHIDIGEDDRRPAVESNSHAKETDIISRIVAARNEELTSIYARDG
jgi:hypothetical protein